LRVGEIEKGQPWEGMKKKLRGGGEGMRGTSALPTAFMILIEREGHASPRASFRLLKKRWRKKEGCLSLREGLFGERRRRNARRIAIPTSRGT